MIKEKKKEGMFDTHPVLKSGEEGRIGWRDGRRKEKEWKKGLDGFFDLALKFITRTVLKLLSWFNW